MALLEQDHREAEALFAQFEQSEDEDVRQTLARRVCLALTVHATVEEQAFYPAARAALAAGEDGEALLDEATVEHAAAKTLIAEIMAMTPRDLLFDAKVKVLGEYVKHHIEEEETELFPRLRACDLDAQSLGADLTELKVALLLTERRSFAPVTPTRRTRRK
ncbi:MAG: hemerythrin domain-containing protein [Alphaproteobacteria bacterium]|nr:hemerythrin domain-containing protein [Alphaproteobacteria bacterium]